MKQPATSKPIIVTFRSGLVREYPHVKRLRWSDTGHPFDVVAVEVVK